MLTSLLKKNGTLTCVLMTHVKEQKEQFYIEKHHSLTLKKLNTRLLIYIYFLFCQVT